LKAEIRDAHHGDIREIQKAARVTWDGAYRETIPDKVRSEFVDHAYSQASLVRRMMEGVFLVAVINGKIGGVR
jgi:hypothetical protein